MYLQHPREIQELLSTFALDQVPDRHWEICSCSLEKIHEVENSADSGMSYGFQRTEVMSEFRLRLVSDTVPQHLILILAQYMLSQVIVFAIFWEGRMLARKTNGWHLVGVDN